MSGVDVAGHYDDLDFYYRDVWGEHVHHGLWERGDESVREATEALILKTAGALGLREGERVVDIGCGYGGTSRWLAERYGVTVEGFTLSPVQAREARAFPAPSRGEARVRVGDWLENGLASGSADGMVSIECISHVADKARFFEEAIRVLRPGRRMGMMAWLERDGLAAWERRWWIGPICRGGHLAGMETLPGLAALAAGAGFRVLQAEDVSQGAGRTWPVIVWRGLVRLVAVPAYRRLVLAPSAREREAAAALARMTAATWFGVVRYGFLLMEKPR